MRKLATALHLSRQRRSRRRVIQAARSWVACAAADVNEWETTTAALTRDGDEVVLTITLRCVPVHRDVRG